LDENQLLASKILFQKCVGVRPIRKDNLPDEQRLVPADSNHLDHMSPD